MPISGTDYFILWYTLNNEEIIFSHLSPSNILIILPSPMNHVKRTHFGVVGGGVPKTTPRFADSLRGPVGLSL